MSIVFHHVIFRALLRWGAALAFCLPLKHRPGFRLRALGMLLPLMGLTYVLDPSAQSTNLHELQFSLLALYVSFFVLLGMMIYACVEIDRKGALYCAVWSLLTSQTAYEGWRLAEVFFESPRTPSTSMGFRSGWPSSPQVRSFILSSVTPSPGRCLIKESTTSARAS